jgi:hypothetical protein
MVEMGKGDEKSKTPPAGKEGGGKMFSNVIVKAVRYSPLSGQGHELGLRRHLVIGI